MPAEYHIEMRVSYTKSISTLTLSLNLYFSANCQSRLSVITIPLVPRNTSFSIWINPPKPQMFSLSLSFCLKWCMSSLINYENYLSLLFADTSVSVCVWGWLQNSLRAFFMWKDLPYRLEKEKKTQGESKRKEGTKRECVYFSHYRSQGKAVADIKLMWMSPGKYSCTLFIYLFLFWKVEKPAFPYELSLPFKVSVCVFLQLLCFSLSYSSCPSQWTGNRCHIKEKPFFTTASATPMIPDSKLGNWIGEYICTCCYLNRDVLFSIQR